MRYLAAILSVSLVTSLTYGLDAEEQTVQALRDAGVMIRESGGKVIDARVNCDALNEKQFELLTEIESLRSVSLSGKAIDDARLKKLTRLAGLESILINGGTISDEGMKHFAAFPNLKRLSLFHFSRDCEAFTGSGLAHLKTAKKLERLTFAGATVGDAMFVAVSQISQLREFAQWHNLESDQGVRELRKLPRLRSLKMGQRLPRRGRSLKPSLHGETLQLIAQFETLEKLELQEARLSLEDLRTLKGLPNLKELRVKWVDTPGADVGQLKQLLADVKITWEPLSDKDRNDILKKKLRL